MRPVLLVALAVIAAAAWAYLAAAPMPGGMGGATMVGMEMSGTLAPWGWREGALLFVMWGVMMVAMMLPSAAPMILLFSRVSAGRSGGRGGSTATAFFVGGYLVVWWAFSAVAAVLQWSLHSAALLSPEMRTASPVVGAAILIAAGIYQWLPLKKSCLTHCRAPLDFLMTSWREGRAGATLMGIQHGAFCVGCCWMLMALLFVAGVMNLLWVVVLSIVVLVEKIAVVGALMSRAAGALLVLAGLAMLL